MGCCHQNHENLAEKFIKDFISSYKVFYLFYIDFSDIIENFDKRITINTSADFSFKLATSKSFSDEDESITNGIEEGFAILNSKDNIKNISNNQLRVLDATAGLGKDAFIMSLCGFNGTSDKNLS